jgi:hypothetical protein
MVCVDKYNICLLSFMDDLEKRYFYGIICRKCKNNVKFYFLRFSTRVSRGGYLLVNWLGKLNLLNDFSCSLVNLLKDGSFGIEAQMISHTARFGPKIRYMTESLVIVLNLFLIEVGLIY